MLSNVQIEICIPRSLCAERKRAYTQALIKDIRLTAEELGGEAPACIHLRGAMLLPADCLSDVAICLRKSFPIADTFITCDMIPEFCNLGVMTVLRNLGTKWYTLYAGTMNAVDCRTLKGVNDLSLYDNLRRLLRSYDMHNFTVVLDTGIPGITAASLHDSLLRAAELEPGAIELRRCEGDEAVVSGAWTGPQLQAYRFCKNACGEIRVLPEMEELLLRSEPGSDSMFGIGCDAVTEIEDLRARNTSDPEEYIRYVGNPMRIMHME